MKIRWHILRVGHPKRVFLTCRHQNRTEKNTKQPFFQDVLRIRRNDQGRVLVEAGRGQSQLGRGRQDSLVRAGGLHRGSILQICSKLEIAAGCFHSTSGKVVAFCDMKNKFLFTERVMLLYFQCNKSNHPKILFHSQEQKTMRIHWPWSYPSHHDVIITS